MKDGGEGEMHMHMCMHMSGTHGGDMVGTWKVGGWVPASLGVAADRLQRLASGGAGGGDEAQCVGVEDEEPLVHLLSCAIP